jgi:putative DNA primase/helicase
LQQARQVGLGESDLGLIIPIPGPDGQIQAIKYRLRALSQKGERYRYLTPGRGTPAWFSQFYGTEQQRPVLVVEGELNGIATWFALEDWDVVGIAGVTGEVPVQHLQGRQIYLLADDDEAGRGWVNRWKETLGATGLPPLPGQMDACEYATEYGPAALRRVILAAAGI